jgi:putative selenate reductase
MTARVPPLTPWPLRLLLGRIAREWELRGQIFDLPGGKFYRSDPACDLSLEVAGRRIATPAGPAAGPHTQLAQNLVLGWLAGARAFELKTAQVLDELDIPRPCIDVETVGFNVEWSQELSLDASLDEYVKGAMILDVLRHWPPLREQLGEPGAHVLEMSVGYDLAGIRSPRMGRWIAGLLAAAPLIDAKRRQIDGPFAPWRDLDFPSRLVDSATLSTFHGCPAAEIEQIAQHLMVTYDLDVTIKLNPTLLGFADVATILHDRLGYDELAPLPEAFADDLSWSQAVGMIERLDRFARERGRIFGVKLTNTLVVANGRRRLPGERVYLSGPPLHVLAITLLDRLVDALPGLFKLGESAGTVPVAFSAGISRDNFPAAVGLGLAPVTVCTDLLKPGGYGRLAPMLRHLARTIKQAGYRDIPAWQRGLQQDARAGGRRDAIAAYGAAVLQEAGGGPYAQASQVRPTRIVDRDLDLWDCTSCHLCVTVCPNDAFTRLPTPVSCAERLQRKWQYICWAELCNNCGNCQTFCPERGDPARAKPRLFVQPARFAHETASAFLVSPVRDAREGPFAIVATPDRADQVECLRRLCNGPAGLPVAAEDLATAREGHQEENPA